MKKFDDILRDHDATISMPGGMPTTHILGSRGGSWKGDPAAIAFRGPPQRAASIRAFISRTAASRPTKTARQTIAWPMFSSAIPGMRATSATLR